MAAQTGPLPSMDTPTGEEIARRLAAHGPKRPPAYASLRPDLDLVRALRHKRASFETVRHILRPRGVEVSETSIRNFCREVLGEVINPFPRTARRGWRMPATPAATEPVREPAPPDAPPSVPVPDARGRGPRIANLKRGVPETP